MKLSSLVICLCLMMVGVSLATCQMMMKKKGKKGGRMRKGCGMMMSMEKDISSLRAEVKKMSIPVNVHVHGVDGQVQDVVPYFSVNKPAMADSSREEEEGVSEMSGMDMEHGQGHHHMMMHHRDRKMDRLMEDDGEDEDEEESSEESSEEKEEKGGTHVHIHLNLGGQIPRQPSHSPTVAHGEYTYPENEYQHAKCDMLRNNAVQTNHNVRGTVYLRQKPSQDLEVKVDLYGFDVRGIQHKLNDSRHLHGFHVHEFADFSNGCNSFGGHFNPTGVHHGGPEHHTRHAGDWGNIECDHRGVARTSFTEKHSTLLGPNSVVGRGIVIHERADDHGEGGTDASKASGDAGGRIACCVITWYKGGVW